MARMIFTEPFIDDAAAIWSPTVERHLESVLSMLEAFPESGSRDIPPSIQSRFGGQIRKCAITPFDLVYSYEEEGDRMILRGLIPQAAMH